MGSPSPLLVSASSYIGGGVLGLVIGLLAMLAFQPWDTNLFSMDSSWLALNMGHSVWFFGAVLIFYSANLIRLDRLIVTNAPLTQVVQLDQLSDVWIHLFIGIGVIWTAIGMRSALATTLDAPASLNEGAGEILSRLVDGGILLALTTTIVGAIGGYIMQLTKTISLGAELTGYYQREERREVFIALAQLNRMESHLARIAPPLMTSGILAEPQLTPLNDAGIVRDAENYS
ncbi:MAG: hypothetical protein O6945_13700 [Gammaproteobacteria bacterium]|nr:hypothetical protein [Gammaproteobacteria bacterium]